MERELFVLCYESIPELPGEHICSNAQYIKLQRLPFPLSQKKYKTAEDVYAGRFAYLAAIQAVWS